VHYTVAVAVIECASDLPTELAGLLLFELAMGDDVVEHLAAVDVLKQHVPVVVCADNITQATYIGVVEECYDGGFASGSDLLGLVGPLLFGT